MMDANTLKQKLGKKWRQYGFHKAWLADELSFPFQVNIKRPNDKTLLHDYAAVQDWLSGLQQMFTSSPEVRLLKQDVNYSTMGRQRMPVAVEFAELEALARFLGQWQQWQQFRANCEKIRRDLPALESWLKQNPAQVVKYRQSWPQLIAVCRFLLQHPRPGCYIRQLEIGGVDTKFIENHRSILKALLDQLLPEQAIDHTYGKLSEHGFERRFGLAFEQPQLRFRLLDPALAAEFCGVSDLSMPVSAFAGLDLLLDRVFITENRVNGLAFPEIKNALVIFGLGYGIQILKQVDWLTRCKLYYWGDIDSHGFVILSQLRDAFPKAESLLMDEATLTSCRPVWGEEPVDKVHAAETLPNLTPSEQQLYHQLKTQHWQERLRLEQERIPFHLLREKLQALK